MTPNRRTGFLLVMAMLVLGVAGSASAQERLLGLNAEGSVEFGGRVWLTEEPIKKNSQKFDEYRDMSPGFLIENLRLRLFTPDEAYSTEILGSKLGKLDQDFSLSTGRIGKWQFDLGYDQMRHVFGTNGRTLLHEGSAGNWRAPVIDSLTQFNGQASSRELHDISVMWYTGRLGLMVSPSPDMDISSRYTVTRKLGDRPFSMSFGTGSGGNFLELVEPIQQTVHDFRLGMTIAKPQWQFQVGYTFSAFQNDVDRVTFQNPCYDLAAGAPECPAADTNAGGAAQLGRSSLPPDNMAHTVNIGGGLNLPLRTRITGNFAYSFWLQNAGFLPIATRDCPGCGVMPQSDLGGLVRTANANIGLTSRPFALPLTFSAKYRLYDLNDDSDNFLVPAHALNDRVGTIEDPLRPERHSWRRHNADLDARYQVLQSLATTVGVGWEEMHRGPERQVMDMDEVFFKAAVDMTPADWLLARLTYKPSIRRVDYAGHAPGGVQQNSYARRFDQADRDRQRVDLMLQFTPSDVISITPTGSLRFDDYPKDNSYGIRQEYSWAAGIDVNWAPVERFSLGLGYMHEVNNRDLRARMTFDATSFNTTFLSNIKDTFDTVRLSSAVGVIPKLLDWTFGVDFATSYGSVKTRNEGLAGGGAPAPPGRWPDVDDELLRLETALKYRLSKSWQASLSYAFEHWVQHDFRTDNWLPRNPLQMPAYGNVYLGVQPADYDNHTMGLMLTYTFGK